VDLRLFTEGTERGGAVANHEAERARLQREREKIERQMAGVEKQLANEDFRRCAPREVVRGAQSRHAELAEHYRKVVESLERLGNPPSAAGG
jgi:valyl-tRNA synthetase